MRKEHGEHNEELCDHLLTNGKYNDWVVTTAFYSALNFVKHEIFPFQIRNGKKYDEFEHYFNAEVIRGVDKHESLKDLVCKNIKGCSGAYRWLLDASKSARYHNYKVSENEAKKARKMLAAVKENCKKLEAEL